MIQPVVILDSSGNPITHGQLVAGTAIIGKVGIDQTTDGTTNKVYVGNTPAVTCAACATAAKQPALGTASAASTDIISVVPTANSTAAIAPTIVQSSALESNHVLKASPGNLYSVYVTTAGTAGWLLTYNGTSAPTAGGAAIAPVDCVIAPANSTVGISMGGDPPDAFSTGIVAVFSSSGCFTNTASTTVFFKGRVK